MRIIFICLVSLASQFCFAQQSGSAKFSEEILDIELSFSKASEAKGFRMANLEYAADDAVVFRPFEINAIEWSNRLKGQDSSYRLSWYPSVVEASAAGDLGYGSGPFENVSLKDSRGC